MNLNVLISELLSEESSPLLKYDLSVKTEIPLVAKATIDIFYQLVRHPQAFECLYKSLPSYIDRVYPAPRAIWINLLLELCPENTIKSLLQDLNVSFTAAIPLPTGLSIKFGPFRGIHMSKSFLEIFSKCRNVAVRLVLHLAGKSLTYPAMYQEYKTDENRCVSMLLSSLSHEKDQNFITGDDKTYNDSLQHLIAGSSLLHICLTPTCLTFTAKTSVLHTIVSNMNEHMPSLLDSMRTVSAACDELHLCKINFKNADDEYKTCLMIITGTRNESELQFPLILYLSENEELNQLYVKSNELNTVLLQKEKEVDAIAIVFLYHATYLRLLIVITARLILVILGVTTDSCSSKHARGDDHISRYTSLIDCFDSFNWELFSQYIGVEKKLFGVPVSRILPSFLCRISNKYQDFFTHFPVPTDDNSTTTCIAYDAFCDLTRYCSVEETGSDASELVTKLQLPSLRVRINTMCCCNSFYSNSAMSRRVAGYSLSSGEVLWLKLLQNILASLDSAQEPAEDTGSTSCSDKSDGANRNMYNLLRQVINRCGDEYYKNRGNPLGITVNKLDFLHLVNSDLESTLVSEVLLLSSFEGIGAKRFRFSHPLDVIQRILASDVLLLEGIYSRSEAFILPIIKVITEHVAVADSELFPIRYEKINEVKVHKLLHLFSLIITGPIHSHFHPSLTQPHEHNIIPSLYYQRVYRNNRETQGELLKLLTTLCCHILFNAKYQFHVGMGVDNVSTVAVTLQCLSAIATVDTALVHLIMPQSCQREGFVNGKKQANPWLISSDAYVNMCLPFMLVLEGGNDAMFKHLVKHRRYSVKYEELEELQDLFTHFIDASLAIILEYIRFFSIITDLRNYEQNVAISQALMSYGEPLVHSLNQYILFENGFLDPKRKLALTGVTYRLLTNLLLAGRDAHKGTLLFISASNDIRNFFNYEFNGVGSACSIVIAIVQLLQHGAATNTITTSYDEHFNHLFLPYYIYQSSHLLSCPGNDVFRDTSVTDWYHSLYDTLTVILEFLIEMAHGRMEIQDVVNKKYSRMYRVLPYLLQRRTPTPQYGHAYHVGIANLVCVLLSYLAHRSSEGQGLINKSGCVEGLIFSLIESLPHNKLVGQEELAKQVVNAIEKLIVNNYTCWKNIQKVGGIDTLLHLCIVGNASVRNTCCDTITQKCLHDMNYRVQIIEAGGVPVLCQLLAASDQLVQLHSLNLMLLLLEHSSARSLMKQNDAIQLISKLVSSNDTGVVRAALQILTVLGTDDSATLRALSTKTNSGIQQKLFNLSTNKPVLSTPEKSEKLLPPLSGHKPSSEEEKDRTDLYDIAKLSMISFAAQVDSRESAWPDSTPQLRQTLLRSGILPSL